MVDDELEATLPGDPSWRPHGTMYVFVSEWAIANGDTSFPKIYHRSSAKSNFTRSYGGDYWNYGSRSRIDNNINSPLEQQWHDRWNQEALIFKMDNDTLEWRCIFNPKSPAGQAFAEGQLTARQLRDSIEW